MALCVCVLLISFYQTSLDYVFNGVSLKNNEAIEAMLQVCIDKAIGEITIRLQLFPGHVSAIIIHREISSGYEEL